MSQINLEIPMFKAINRCRRTILGTAAVTFAAAQLGIVGSATAQPRRKNLAPVPPIKPGTNTSFSPLTQIDAGTLNIGYAEAGPVDGPAVIPVQSRHL